MGHTAHDRNRGSVAIFEEFPEADAEEIEMGGRNRPNRDTQK